MVTASALRNDIYNLLDEVVEGTEIKVQRKGTVLKITRVEKQSKLSRLTRHDCIVGDPDDLVHMDWSGEWNSDLP